MIEKGLTMPPISATSTADCIAASETVRLESGDFLKSWLMIACYQLMLWARYPSLWWFSCLTVLALPHSFTSPPPPVIPAGACVSSSPLPHKYASQVSVNDCVMAVTGEERVSSIETILAEGLYTIVTKEVFIVVNGIV